MALLSMHQTRRASRGPRRAGRFPPQLRCLLLQAEAVEACFRLLRFYNASRRLRLWRGRLRRQRRRVLLLKVVLHHSGAGVNVEGVEVAAREVVGVEEAAAVVVVAPQRCRVINPQLARSFQHEGVCASLPYPSRLVHAIWTLALHAVPSPSIQS